MIKIKKLIALTLFTFTVLFLTGINNSYALEQTEFKGQMPKETSETRAQAESSIKNKMNIKDNYKKMSSDLVRLVENEFNTSNLSREQLKENMKDLHQLVPVGRYSAQGFNNATGDLVHVYMQMNSNSGISAIESLVNKIENIDENNDIAVAWVNVNNLDALSSLSTVKSIRTVIPPIFSTISQGDNMLLASQFRTYEGVDGTGIKVGVISDGVDHWQDARITGDLPDDIHVLRNTYGGDEGTAMLEIIHDLASGAELYFHDCGDNVLDFNAAVDELINAGCNVICDDIYWPAQPYFEDGIVAQHITSVIASHDIVFVSPAGNSARSHYQGTYYNDGYGYHDFSQGSSGYKNLYIDIPAEGKVLVVLQWDDQFGHAANDYDLYLRKDSVDGETLAFSNDTQNGSDDPLEGFIYTNNTGTAIDGVVDVKKDSGSNKTLEVYIFPLNGTGVYSNNITAGDSIFGHTAVPGVIAVGEVDYPGGNTAASYSSQGPVTIKYPSLEIRNKPDICALGGVSVSGAGGFPSPFYGTSAAAPHVAAIAALAWSYNPTQTATEVRNAIVTSADDLGSTGYDNIYGFGRVNALGIISTPELVIDSMNAPSEIYGTSFNETDTVRNIGTAIQNDFNISYYLSPDNILDVSDICIGQRDITWGIPARTGCSYGLVNLTIPSSVPNGKYYLYMLVDPTGIINETNKKNNSKGYGPITININRTCIISTVAGNGAYGYSGDGASAISAKLFLPKELVFDSSGNLYIADEFNQRIRKVDISGIITTVAGTGVEGYSGDGGPATSAQLGAPIGLAIDKNQNLYIAEERNQRIRKVDTSGKISTVAGNGVAGYSGDGGPALSAQLDFPAGVTFDTSGNMYIAEERNQRIRKVDTSGKISTVAGNGVDGYSGDGGPATAASLSYPLEVTFDSRGNMYIADCWNQRIRKVNTSGIITTIAGTGVKGYSGDEGPAVSAQLNDPRGIKFDSNGNLYIADCGNHRIRKVDTSGNISTVAGNGTGGYSGDGGVSMSAALNYPVGVAFDSNGNLYIADNQNNCIRKVILAEPQNSSLSPATANFDKNPVYQADIPVTVALNGNTLTSITNAGIPLNAGTDYNVAGSVYTIAKKYLALMPVGTTTLMFNFRYGSSQALSITVINTSPLGIQSVSAINGSVTVNLNRIPAAPPVLSDFVVTRSVNDGNAASVTPTELNINGSVVTLAVPMINGESFEQSVVYSVSYKSAAPVDAHAFTIEAQGPHSPEDIDAGKSSASIADSLAPGISRAVTITLKNYNGEPIKNTSKDIIIGVTVINGDVTTAEEYTVAGQVCTASKVISINATSDDQGQISFSVLLPPAIDTGDGLSIQVKTVNGNKIGVSFGYPVKDECFIATAAYGSNLQPAVVLLRQFRDSCLLTSRVGREFVNFYYHNSPPIAALIAQSEPLKALVRVLLLPVIALAYTTFHPGMLGVLVVLILFGLLYRRKVQNRVD